MSRPQKIAALVGPTLAVTFLSFAVLYFLPNLLPPPQYHAYFGIGLLVLAGVSATSSTLSRQIPPLNSQLGLVSLLLALTGLGILITAGRSWSTAQLDGTFTPSILTPVYLIIAAILFGWLTAIVSSKNLALAAQRTARYFTALATILPVGGLFFVVFYIVSRGSPILSWEFVSTGSDFLGGTVGIFPAIMGTVWLLVGALIFAVPLGIGAAVFLREFAKRTWLKRAVGITADCLWATPSIVFGLFGYIFLVPRLTGHSTLLAGQLILGAMLLPLTIATTTEALESIPDDFRRASLALGSSKWWTIKKVVLPSSVPGITTGILLGVGRIAGETAPIMLIAVASQVGSPKFFSSSPPYFHIEQVFQEVDALPYHLYAIYEAGVGGSIQEAWGTALVLLIVVSLFFLMGIIIRSYYRARRGW
ncbi:MAG: phosphate ABC transporter permease PstA [Candidatus Bipolaricaulota bacterium]